MAGPKLLDLDHDGIGSSRDENRNPDPRFRRNFREEGIDPHARRYNRDTGY
jgi:hypothetical protein